MIQVHPTMSDAIPGKVTCPTCEQVGKGSFGITTPKNRSKVHYYSLQLAWTKDKKPVAGQSCARCSASLDDGRFVLADPEIDMRMRDLKPLTTDKSDLIGAVQFKFKCGHCGASITVWTKHGKAVAGQTCQQCNGSADEAKLISEANLRASSTSTQINKQELSKAIVPSSNLKCKCGCGGDLPKNNKTGYIWKHWPAGFSWSRGKKLGINKPINPQAIVESIEGTITKERGRWATPEAKEVARKMLIGGSSVREINRATKMANNTVRKVRKDMIASGEMPSKCDCGRDQGHKGWCPSRVAKSPARQHTVARLTESRKETHSVEHTREVVVSEPSRTVAPVAQMAVNLTAIDNEIARLQRIRDLLAEAATNPDTMRLLREAIGSPD